MVKDGILHLKRNVCDPFLFDLAGLSRFLRNCLSTLTEVFPEVRCGIREAVRRRVAEQARNPPVIRVSATMHLFNLSYCWDYRGICRGNAPPGNSRRRKESEVVRNYEWSGPADDFQEFFINIYKKIPGITRFRAFSEFIFRSRSRQSEKKSRIRYRSSFPGDRPVQAPPRPPVYIEIHTAPAEEMTLII